MLSIALNLGCLIVSAFLYTLQQLGQGSDLDDAVGSDLDDAVGQLHSSLLEATDVLHIAERKQQSNKVDEERLRKLLLQLKDAAYDAEELLGDLDDPVVCQKIAEMQNEASHNIPSSSISFAANSSNSGYDDFAAKARRVRERLDAVSNEMQKIVVAQNEIQGSMIMVTTRSETVVQAMPGTLDPIFLKGLPEDDYMEFFKTYAFGSENPKDRPEMEKIAERIAAKLQGSPLAAKILGGSLNLNKEVRHWKNILNTEIWQLQQGENDIMLILRFSYDDLPSYLKPCFSICSIYPQDYNFKATELVYLWMAHGFLVAPRPNMQLEDVGYEYLLDLTSRSFFQKGRCEGEFMIHNLMHHLAKYVSKDDCFSISNDGQKIPSSIRHLSINCTENHELLDEVMKSDYNFNKLWSLLIFGYRKPEINSAIVRWFDRLQYIRVLHLSSCYPIAELPESIGNFKQLQFLKISDHDFSTIPGSFCRLYNLKYLSLKKDCPLESFPIGFARIDTGEAQSIAGPLFTYVRK